MSTKPTSLPRWADVSGDIVEPTSGKKDVGWVSDEEPPAQYFNWLLNLIYLWTRYLSDGVFDGDVQFLDNVDIDGNLNVDGSFSAADLTGTDFVATTEGDIRHAEVRHRMPMPFYGNGVIVGNLDFTLNATGNAYFISSGGTVTVLFEMPLKEGDRLKTIRVVCYDGAGGSNIVAKGWKIGRSTVAVPATVGTQLGSTQTSASSANMQNLNITGLTETVADPVHYFIAVTITANPNARVYDLEYTVDRIA